MDITTYVETRALVTARIQAGVSWIEAHIDEMPLPAMPIFTRETPWYDRIRLERFSFQSSYTCILGHLFGAFYEAVDMHGDNSQGRYFLTLAEAFSLGLTARDSGSELYDVLLYHQWFQYLEYLQVHAWLERHSR